MRPPLRAEGAKVVVTDINPEGVERVSDDIGTVGLAVDITVEDNVRAVADLARAHTATSTSGSATPATPGRLRVATFPTSACGTSAGVCT